MTGRRAPPKRTANVATHALTRALRSRSGARTRCGADAFEPRHDTLVFVCGLPAMYKVLCGPREESTLRDGSVLEQLGYTSDMVTKL